MWLHYFVLHYDMCICFVLICRVGCKLMLPINVLFAEADNRIVIEGDDEIPEFTKLKNELMPNNVQEKASR